MQPTDFLWSFISHWSQSMCCFQSDSPELGQACTKFYGFKEHNRPRKALPVCFEKIILFTIQIRVIETQTIVDLEPIFYCLSWVSLNLNSNSNWIRLFYSMKIFFNTDCSYICKNKYIFFGATDATKNITSF